MLQQFNFLFQNIKQHYMNDSSPTPNIMSLYLKCYGKFNDLQVEVLGTFLVDVKALLLSKQLVTSFPDKR